MVRTPHKGRCMNGIRFIRDDTVRVEVPDFVSFIRFCGEDCLISCSSPTDLGRNTLGKFLL
jgi:hypothetical protein